MKNIAIRLPNWIGDFVMSLGLLDKLRRSYPDSNIIGYGRKHIVELAEMDSRFSYCIPIDDHGIQGKITSAQNLRDFIFDLHFVLPPSFSSAFIASRTSSVAIKGYTGEGRSLLLTHPIKKQKNQHRVLDYVQLLSLEIYNADVSFEPSKKDSGVFKRFNIPEDYIVLNPFAVAKSRRLSIEKARELASEMDNLVLIGNSRQQPLCTNIGKGINTAGKTTLSELVTILKKARVVVTVDSGPAHLANALGTNVIDLSGPDDPDETKPWNQDKLLILREPVPCSPCVKNTCRYGTNECIQKIDNGRILDAISVFSSGEKG